MKPVLFKNQAVVTTSILAERLGADETQIKKNFNNNKERYFEGVHYYLLTGNELRDFKREVQILDLADIAPNVNQLYLWTEKGAFHHVKSLGTDQAWNAFQNLVDSYFRVRDIVALPSMDDLVSNPDLVIQLATQVKEEREKTRILAAQNQKMQAKSDFVDRIIDNDEMIDIGQTAKILELPFGRNTLFEKLREKGIFFKNKNEPKQEYIDRGYFILKEKWIERNTHSGFTVLKVLVTQKGLAFIHKLFPTHQNTRKVIKLA